MIILNRKELKYIDLPYLGERIVFDPSIVQWLKDSNELGQYASGEELDYIVEFRKT